VSQAVGRDAGLPGVTPGRPPDAWAASETSLHLDARLVAVLAYAAAWASGLAVLFLERRSRFARFHAAQSVTALGGLTVFALGCWGVGLIMAFESPWLFRALTWLSTLSWGALAVLWMICLVQASRGSTFHLPLAGRLADRLTSRRSIPPAPRPRP
jgi:uncharacterized membrane protein